MPDNDHDNEGKKDQTYVVKTDFVDDKGRSWAVGSVFTGDEGAVKKALAAGQIAARPPKPEPKE